MRVKNCRKERKFSCVPTKRCEKSDEKSSNFKEENPFDVSANLGLKKCAKVVPGKSGRCPEADEVRYGRIRQVLD